MSEYEKAIGSIYFPGGRIRLIHSDGPKIITNDSGIERYTLNMDEDYSTFKSLKTFKQGLENITEHAKESELKEKYDSIMKNSCTLKRVEAAGNLEDAGKANIRLIEFFGVNGKDGVHVSRGEPVFIATTLTQIDINKLIEVAQNNRRLIDQYPRKSEQRCAAAKLSNKNLQETIHKNVNLASLNMNDIPDDM